MIASDNSHRIVFVNRLDELRLFKIRIDKLSAESRLGHIEKEIELFAGSCMLVRWPARPVTGLGHRDSHQQTRTFDVLCKYFVDIAVVRLGTNTQRKRVAALYAFFKANKPSRPR